MDEFNTWASKKRKKRTAGSPKPPSGVFAVLVIISALLFGSTSLSSSKVSVGTTFIMSLAASKETGIAVEGGGAGGAGGNGARGGSGISSCRKENQR
jgi:hypothetical protein